MKHVFSAVVVACIATQTLYAQTMNRPMDTNDPNRDPNWVWYEANQRFVTLYPAGLPPQDVTLPFFDNTGPATAFITDLTDGPMDIYPNQGWELVLRDFGTPQTQQPIPFFILYNKYRGILRLYYWDPDNSQQTIVVGMLRFQGAKQTGNMTLGFDNATLDNYQNIESYEQIAVGDYENRSWCFMDFDLSGYDPDVVNQRDPTFIIELHGRTISDLVLSGTLDFEHEKGSVTAVQKVADKYTKAAKRYKGVTAAKKVYKEWGEAESTKWYANILKGAANVATNGFIPYLGAAAGLLDFAIGNGGKGPLLKKAYLELSGQLTTQTRLSTLTIRVPGSIHTNQAIDELSNTLPLYDVPLGVFNLQSVPEVEIFVTETEEIDYDFVRMEPTYHHYLKSFRPVFNPHVFSDIEIELSDQWTGMDEVSRSFNFKTFTAFINSSWSSRSHGAWYTKSQRPSKPWIDTFEPWDIKKVLAVRASLTPLDNSVQDTEIIKSYHPNHTGFESLYPSNTLPGRPDYASLPFYEDFQANLENWELIKGSPESIRISSELQPDQGYYLAMDNGDYGDFNILNEARLYVNVPQTGSDTFLYFELRNFDENHHEEDGIFLSVDGGAQFTKISPLHFSYRDALEQGPWYRYGINLSREAHTNGLELSPTTVISFRQYDNGSIPRDGFGLDQIRVFEEGNTGLNGDYPMVYENLVNVEPEIFSPGGAGTGGHHTGVLTKISDCLCWNAGASSRNSIAANEDGFVKTYITPANLTRDFMFGLSHSDAGYQWNTIDYNLYYKGYNYSRKILIYERGNYRHTYTGGFQIGDELKVERRGLKVYFYINDQEIYSLPVDRSKPMVTDVSLYNENVSFRAYSTAYYQTYQGIPPDIDIDPGDPNPPPPPPTPHITSKDSYSNLNEPKYELPPYGNDVLADTAMLNLEPLSIEKTRVFPNPVEGIFTLEYDSDQKKTVAVSYWNSLDPTIRNNFDWDVEKGSNERKVDFSSIPAGFYILQLNDGVELSSIHVIKE